MSEELFNKLDLSQLDQTIRTENLSPAEIRKMLQYMEILRDEARFSGFRKWFVPGTPFGIENLPKHSAFFKAGAKYRERFFSASNRTGKSISGCYEVTLHLTGEYPDWWEGKRFDNPTLFFACGDTNLTVKNILQAEMLGTEGHGTGMIPPDLIIKTESKAGVTGAVQTVHVRHKSGGISVLTFQSYEQGTKAFYGVKLDGILCDELPPEDIYAEAFVRTMTRDGIMLITATPLDGLTPLVLNFYTKADFLPEGAELPGVVKLAREDAERDKAENAKKGVFEKATEDRQKAVILASWDDAPWLSEKAKREILESIPPHEREARSKGLPSMGSGTVYPIAIEEIVVNDFPIPAHWKRVYGMDVGWNATAAIHIAQDPDTKECYIYSEYKRGKAEPVVHAAAIKAKGDWIIGLIDPASRGRSPKDGSQLIADYRTYGLKLFEADNKVESGIYRVWEMLSTGQLKVFRSCIEWQKEYITYRRDDRGRIIKENDHEMDATRYAIMGLQYARQKPVKGQGGGKVYGGTNY